jgi:putative Ig domain-containing protein
MLGIADAPAPGSGNHLTPGMVGDWYTTTLTATDGAGAGITWGVVGPDSLPSGLMLSASTGEISGFPLPTAQGTSRITTKVSDSSGAVAIRPFSLIINPALQISSDIQRDEKQIRLIATGGAPPYRWEIAGGNELPPGMELDANHGWITLKDEAPTGEAAQVVVRAVDSVGHIDDLSVKLQVRSNRILARRQPESKVLKVKFPFAPRWMRSTTFWLSLIAIWLPTTAVIPIFIYAISYPGQHWKYLADGLLAGIAAQVTGVLIGFLFGLPKAVTPNQSGSRARYLPSANLPDVSDWLTKLLLGAGLVQLTHLGRPVGQLIDSVARGLYDPGTTPAAMMAPGSAKVLAGSILFGYLGIGILSGYVVTATWYLRKLNGLAP